MIYAKAVSFFPSFCKGKFQFRFVVEMGIPLIAVKSKFISFRHQPHCRRNGTALLGLDGQIGAGLAAFEQQLVIWDLRSPHNSGIRAAELHLFHVQIAAVGKVKLFHAIKSFLKGIPFHHHKTAEAVEWGGIRLCLLVAESPCGVSGEVFGEKVSGGGEFLAN